MVMNSKQWKARLGKMANFNQAKKDSEKLGENLPDGRYRVVLEKVELAESKTSGREQINFFGKVKDGEFDGENCNFYPGLDDKSLHFTIAALRKLGFDIDEAEEIVDAVESLNAELPEIFVQVSKGYTNVQGLATAVDDGNEGAEEDQASENEPEAEEVIAEEAEVEIGSEVVFNFKGEELRGTVSEILEKEQKLKIKSGGKLYTVKAENVSLVEPETAVEEEAVEEEVVEEDSEEPIEEEKKPAKKPVGKKPAPKKPAPAQNRRVTRKR